MAEKDAEMEKRKQMIDEIYGYGDMEDEEKKDKFKEMLQAYMEHRKQKQQAPLKHIFG